MIEFKKIEVPKEERIGLLVRGHANYKKRGDDIVCAGVSAIAQSCLLACSKHGQDLDIKFCVPGRFVFTVAKEKVAEVLIEAALDGIEHIAKIYPKCFKVSEED